TGYGDLRIEAGGASPGYAGANGGNARATAQHIANVSLVGSAVALTGRHVSLCGGYGLGHNASDTAVSGDAFYTADGNVLVQGGAGGVSLTGSAEGSVQLRGGSQVGRGGRVHAGE